MSKTDQMRALREARYSTRVRRPAPSPTPPQPAFTQRPETPTTVAPSPAPPVAVTPVPALSEPVPTPSAPEAPAVYADAGEGRPDVPAGRPIHAYRPEQLAALARWVARDGQTRSMDEYVLLLMAELSFVRRGKKITSALEQAVRAAGVPTTEIAAA